MNDLENYKELIDSIFGSNTANFDTTTGQTNNVIGALNFDGDFDQFKLNFRARLNRLNRIYSTVDNNRKELIDQVNLIADKKNWDGAFAELATFDCLNQDILQHKTFLFEPITLNHTIDKSKTFGEQLGKDAANLDGYYNDYDVYFDVKCFKDNVTEILKGIYRELKIKIGNSDFTISAEYSLDVSYDDFKNKRNYLLNELAGKINTSDKPKYVKSDIIGSLSFRLIWGSGILTAERTYSPFKHAKNYHKTIFNYADKFVKDRPAFIVLVVFPWFNLVVNSFSDGNKQMYRAFARRVFCQYKNDNTKFKTFNSKFNSEETIFNVSQKISGIVFLEDHTILSNQPNKTNVKPYVFFNPNSDNKLRNSLVENVLLGLDNEMFDDFEYDNY